MTDDDRPAGRADYYDHRLARRPTWAHMIGEYAYADRFEDVSRAGEDAADRRGRGTSPRRAEAIDEDGLDEQRADHPRRCSVWDATSQADLLEARTDGARRPTRSSACRPARRLRPRAARVPDAEVAEAMVGKFEGVAPLLPRPRRAAPRGRRVRARPGRRSRSRQTVEQLDGWLADPDRRGPDARACRTRPPGSTPHAWRERLLRRRARSRCGPAGERYRDVLRDEVAAARAARRAVRADLAARRRRRPTTARLRYFTTTDQTAQEIHEIGLAQVAEARRRVPRARPRGGRHRRPRRRSSTAMRDDPTLHHTSGDEIVEDSKTAMARRRAAMGDWFEVGCRRRRLRRRGHDERREGLLLPAGRRTAAAAACSSSTSPTPTAGAASRSRRWPSTRASRATTSSSRSPPSCDDVPEFRKHVLHRGVRRGLGALHRAARRRDGAVLLAARPDRDAVGATRCAPAGSSSTPACTPSAGAGSRRSTTCSRTRPMRPGASCRRRSTATSCRPGQATSYMIGRLEIQRMRREAEQRQGEAFDIKAFHDAVLDSGPMPLGLLDAARRRAACRRPAVGSVDLDEGAGGRCRRRTRRRGSAVRVEAGPRGGVAEPLAGGEADRVGAQRDPGAPPCCGTTQVSSWPAVRPPAVRGAGRAASTRTR